MSRIHPLLLMLFAVLTAGWLSGCTLTSLAPVENGIPPTPTAVTRLMGTPVPTLSRISPTLVREYRPVDTPIVVSDIPATPEATVEPVCGLAASLPLTRHTVRANLDYETHAVVVDQTVTYINRTGAVLNDIVLNIEPNRYPGAFTLFSLAQITATGARTPTFNLTGRRLVMELVEPLAMDCALKLQMSFLINIPPVSGGVMSFLGYFGYTDRQTNLGHWLPTVALRAGDEWITRQAVTMGEQEVLVDADWDVLLRVNKAPEHLTVAMPGEVTQPAPGQWRGVLPAAREFPLSMSPLFTVSQATTKDGITLELYTLPDTKVQVGSATVDGATHALTMGKEALETYSDVYGLYPYPRMLVIEGDFPDGMEFTGLVFVSTTWFKQFTGDPAGYLTLITVHEIAHQWWYARVGNDPALAPWLDEALATYSELVFIEEYYPELKDWWWQFRVNYYAPEGFVDSTVYEFSSVRDYINAIYLRGVKLLEAIRQVIGTEAFFDWLHRYAEAGQGEVVTPGFFWSLLTPEQLQATAKVRAVYLRQPTVGGN